MFTFLVQILVSVVLSLLAYLFAPKPKTPKRDFQQMENPTSEAGVPVPVVFGTVTLKSPNFLWYGDKNIRKRKVDA